MKKIKTIGNIAFYILYITGAITFIAYSIGARICSEASQPFFKNIVGMLRSLGNMGIGFFIKILVDQI